MPIDKEAIRAMIRKRAGIETGGPCPVCPDVNLDVLKVEGVDQDFCPQCHGIWLDSGEAAEVGEGIQDFPNFDWSWAQRKESAKKSPRHPELNLWEVPYAEDHSLKVDYCEKSKGIWLDCSEISQLEVIMADNTNPTERLYKLFDDMKKSGYICVS